MPITIIIFEFASLAAGIQPYDVLLSRTDKRFVKFELDVYSATRGSLDAALIEAAAREVTRL